MKKLLLIIACVLLAVLCFTGCAAKSVAYGKEILSNGTFEANSTDGWSLSRSTNDSTDATLEKVNDNSDSASIVGKYYLKITASDYVNYSQRVSLEKNHYYCLSANVSIPSDLTLAEEKAETGAFISISTIYDPISDAIKEKTSEWKKLKVYFNSKDNTSALVNFGVGSEEHNVDGTAYFDGISLVKVRQSELPVGETIYDMGAAASTDYDANYRSNRDGKVYLILATVLGALCLFAAYAAFRTFMGRKDAFLSPDAPAPKTSFFKSSGFFLILCELIGFAVRLIVINFVNGGTTLGAYVTESSQLVDLGASQYYFDSKVTTPIGTLYLLWAMGNLASPLNLVMGSMGYSVFLKIPAVLSDLVIIYLIYSLANRKYNQYISALFAGVYALIPTFFFLSAGWGAYTSVGVLFLLLSLMMLMDKKYVLSISCYALSTLFSTEVLLLMPLLLVYYLYVFFKTDDYKMQISASLTGSVIVLYVLSIHFILTHFTSGHPFIVVKRYCQAFLAQTGFTENAFSVYGFFGLGATKANVASYVFNGILVGLMMLYTGYLFFKSKSRLDIIFLSAFTFAFTAVMTSAVNSLLIVYSLALLLVYGMITGDRRVLKLFGGLTLTTLINTGYTMLIGGYIGEGQNTKPIYMTAADPVLIVFSLVNAVLLGYFAYITYSICVKEEVKGVVVVEGNYFKFAAKQFKSFGKKSAAFFTVTLPAIFKKKNTKEDADVSKG